MFIYAAGFLGVRFVPYIVGYFVGRGIRMSIMTYVTARYGRRVIEVANKYAIIVGAVVVAGAVLYGMVRLHVFGL
jgi:Na+/proline symporter